MADQPASALALRAIAYARSQIGTPYEFGVESRGVGFDCSSLCQWAYEQAGKSIPRTSESQYAAGYPRVEWGHWAPGDLIFSDWGDGQASPGHVVIYVGDGWTIAAPHTGTTVEYEAAATFGGSHYVGSSRPAPLRGAAPPQTGVGKIGSGAVAIPGGNVTADNSGNPSSNPSSTPGTPSSSSSGGVAALFGGLGIAGAAVALVVIGGLVFVILRRRRASPGTPAGGGAAPEPGAA